MVCKLEISPEICDSPQITRHKKRIKDFNPFDRGQTNI